MAPIAEPDVRFGAVENIGGRGLGMAQIRARVFPATSCSQPGESERCNVRGGRSRPAPMVMASPIPQSRGALLRRDPLEVRPRVAPLFQPEVSFMTATPESFNGMDAHPTRYRTISSSGCPAAARGRRGRSSASSPTWSTSRWATSSGRSPSTGKFGREIEQYTSQGLMVPDDLTVRIFERHLKILEMQELAPARAAHPDPGRAAPQLRAGRAARRHHRRRPDLPPQDQRHEARRWNGSRPAPCARTGSTT